MFFLGDRVVADNYNKLVVSTSGESSVAAVDSESTMVGAANRPFLPARIGELRANSQFGVDPLDYRHPIVAPFRGRERSGLLTTPISRFYQLELPEKSTSEIAAAMPSGDPFIVTSAVGEGRIVLVATDASLASVDPQSGEPWTTWPTWPSFLPLIRELLDYAIAGQQGHWEQPVGAPLVVRNVGGTENLKLQVLRPDGRTVEVTSQATSAGSESSYSDTDVSGIYTVRGLPNGTAKLFAVNVDTAESDLTKIDPASFPTSVMIHSSSNERGDSGSINVPTRAGWNLNFLWTALGVLFVESFLAWRFGRGTA